MSETKYENIEWEILQEPKEIEKISPNVNVPKKVQNVKIYRDDFYRIKAKLRGIKQANDNGYLKEEAIGSFLNLFTIEGVDNHSSNIELKDCFIQSEELSHESGNLELEIIAQELKIKNNTESETERLSEWYINSPNKIYFPRSTTRRKDKICRQIVTLDIETDKEIEESDERIPLRKDLDFAFIDTEPVKLILARVPREFGPDWSNNICIEYRKEFGSIPDFEQRRAISEIISFVLGKQLLFVGFTKYDHDNQVLESIAKSPWGDTYSKFVCPKNENSPFNFEYQSYIENKINIEEILCQLIPQYLVLRNDLNLKDALWRYWISKNMVIGTNLPVLSSALETLMKGWFKNRNSRSKAHYIPQKEFMELLGEDFKSIEKKLDEYIKNKTKGLELEEKELIKKQEEIELKKPIMGKIHGSNDMSLTKRYQTFFKEIELEIGVIEDKAIKARHSMAHGDNWSEDIFNEMIKCTLAYETLFHRVFLKMLGYKGKYVDRSIIGYPEKNIDLALGE